MFFAAFGRGLLGALDRFLGDLLAPLERVLPGLLEPIHDLIGDLAQLLVLDPGRRQEQAREEADSGTADRKAEWVLLRDADFLGALFDLVVSGTAPVTL